jgi:hypothetical protein
MRESLHCIAHDSAVSCFGRDDDFYSCGSENRATATATTEADPLRLRSGQALRG